MDDLEEELENTRELNLWQPLLGVYPYILIQFEPVGETYRIGVDYDLMTGEEVIETLRQIIEEVTASD